MRPCAQGARHRSDCVHSRRPEVLGCTTPELPMLAVAAIVIPVLILEQADAGATWDAIDSALNWGIWLAFLAELVAMLAEPAPAFGAVAFVLRNGVGEPALAPRGMPPQGIEP